MDGALAAEASVKVVMLFSQAVVLVKLATGKALIVMGIVSDRIQPLVLMMCRITWKVPAEVNEWLGF